MAYSKVPFTYTGGPQVFATNFALGILEVEHIKVYVDGVVDGLGEPVEYAFTYDEATGDVTVTDALTPGQTGTINRVVPIDALIADFEAGADVSKRNLVRAVKQTLMAVQEAADGREADSNAIASAVQEVNEIADSITESVNTAVTSATNAAASAASAAQSAQVLQLNRVREFTYESDFIDDETLTYTVGSINSVVTGDRIHAGSARYVVIPSVSVEYTAINVNGVKVLDTTLVACPEMFGKIGISSAEDTRCIQAALDTGKTVHLYSSAYTVNESLVVKSQRVYGKVALAGIARYQTLINVEGNIPCFINDVLHFDQFDIKDVLINYGENAPSTSTGNSNKIGFNFVGSTVYPEHYTLDNIVVRGAWRAFYDNSGSYMSKLRNVEARHCKHGFFKQGGTTIVWENVFARGDGVNSETGFHVRECIGGTFISCAADLLVPSSEAYASAANMFEGCPGITIAGWDAETNIIGAGYSYMRFTDSGGSVNVTGFLGYQNTLVVAANTVTSLVLFDGVHASFSGKLAFDATSLQCSGSGANSVAATLQSINDAKVSVFASYIPGATGGSPALVYSILETSGYIKHSGSTLTALVTSSGEYTSVSDVNSLMNVGYNNVYSVGMFLNVSTTVRLPGDLVPGSSLLPCAANGELGGQPSPSGTWECLGVAAANTAPLVQNAICVTLFRKVA